MYEDHFGLKHNPFQSVVTGEAVYRGPAQAKVISDLRIALTAGDSIAVVTGPVGVGKTTVVQRALDGLGADHLVARLGRTQVGSDELVDLLLAQFGVVREPTRRFECLKTFNRILNERAASGSRVFIVIEDAERLGVDLLEELEALTAADGGSSAGANVILMGRQKLDKLIAMPALERMRQRIRLQQTLERFSAEEVEAYLRHRIDAAGGDFDRMFEPGTALMVRRCSGGIPRVINGLCETALTVAAEGTLTQVTARIIFKVAVEVFGMNPGEAAPAAKASPAARPKTPAARTAAPAVAKKPAAQTPPPVASQVKTPIAPAPKTPQPAAAKPPEPAAAKPLPTPEKKSDPTIPVARVPAAPVAKPRPQAPVIPAATRPEAPRLPDIAGLGVEENVTKPGDGATAGQKAMPELPPKFKFADEIKLDRGSAPKSRPARKIEPPELPTLDFKHGAPKIAEAAPESVAPPAPPELETDDIPTLGDSARVEKIVPADDRPAAAVPKPSPAASTSADFAEPEPPAKRDPAALDEATASFAKIDHDMLEAALASLAVHDEEDDDSPEAEMLKGASTPPAAMPEVTLDKNIEAEKPRPRAATDPAVLNEMAAELERTKSLEELSDKLAETLFGSEELEAISLQLRESAPQEPADSAAAAPAPVAESSKASAEAAQPAAAPGPAIPPAAPKPAAPKPAAAHIAKAAEPVADPSVPPKRGPQPEPIENQFNTSMTATLKTLSARHKPSDEDDARQNSSGLLGRLKDTFKS